MGSRFKSQDQDVLTSSPSGNPFDDVFGGEDVPDENSPFDEAKKDTPGAEDHQDPYKQQIADLDQQIKNRMAPTAGNMVGDFFMGLNGGKDQRLHDLMDYRRQLAGDQHNRGIYSLEAARARADAAKYAADKRLEGQQSAATSRFDTGKYGADRRLEGTKYGADRGLEGRQYTADTRSEDVAAQNTSREKIAEGQNASREKIAAGHDTTAVTNTNTRTDAQRDIAAVKTGELSDSAQLSALTKIYHDRLTQGDADGAITILNEMQQIRRRMNATQRTTPPQNVPTTQGTKDLPAPGGTKPQASHGDTENFGPALDKNGQPVEDGRTGGGGKYVAKGGVWILAS